MLVKLPNNQIDKRNTPLCNTPRTKLVRNECPRQTCYDNSGQQSQIACSPSSQKDRRLLRSWRLLARCIDELNAPRTVRNSKGHISSHCTQRSILTSFENGICMAGDVEKCCLARAFVPSFVVDNSNGAGVDALYPSKGTSVSSVY